MKFLMWFRISGCEKLKYSVGDNIVIAHGISKRSLNLHDDRPFTVVGILEPTGTLLMNHYT